MTDAEVVQHTTEGFEFLCLWARNIAMLPLDEWRDAFSRADATVPILEPTLYRDYLESHKAQLIKKLIAAAIPLKRLVEEAQDLARKE